MQTYELCVKNKDNGSHRNIAIFSSSAEKAKTVALKSINERNEEIQFVYPVKYGRKF